VDAKKEAVAETARGLISQALERKEELRLAANKDKVNAAYAQLRKDATYEQRKAKNRVWRCRSCGEVSPRRDWICDPD
jgi:hypothetical protein